MTTRWDRQEEGGKLVKLYICDNCQYESDEEEQVGNYSIKQGGSGRGRSMKGFDLCVGCADGLLKFDWPYLSRVHKARKEKNEGSG